MKETARDCGRPDTLDGIFDALRARFGLSAREARAKLASLKRNHQTTLQEHAAEVERLVTIAYADLPGRHRQEMAIETFTHSLSHAYLQRHLLAVPTPTLEDAVRTGNEYLQIKPTPQAGSNIRAIDGEEEEDQAEEPTRVSPAATDPMATLLKAIQKLSEEVANLKMEARRPGAKRGTLPPSNKKCWECQQEGYLKRDCPTRPWTDRKEAQASGNEGRPQQ